MMKGEGKDIPSSSGKDGEIQFEGNVKAQTENTALAVSWLGQVKRRFGPSYKRLQVSEKVCIHRVPKPMRIYKPEDFDPFLVSLGPFHHKMNHELSKMDEHKIEAVHGTLERLKRTNKYLTDLTGNIKDLEKEIKECYEEPIDWEGENLSWMFAMDGCFILEFLRTAASSQNGKSYSNQSENNCDNDSKKDGFSLVFQNNDRTNSMFHVIINDIMKMENQIPLVVLKSILRLEFTDERRVIPELCAMLLQGSYLFEGFPLFLCSSADNEVLQDRIHKLMSHVNKEPAHLLDLYRMVIEDLLTQTSIEPASHIEVRDCRGGRNMNKSLSPDDSRCTLSAELLHTAGVKFEPGPIGFRKGRFAKGILSLPQIRVDDSTVTLLRNVMAYEECQRCSLRPKKTVVSQFLVLLDSLIDSAKDVSVLRKARVISSFAASDKDIASRFDNISKAATGEICDRIEEVMKRAREHYDSQCNVWISQILEERCSRPWYLVPVAAGIVVLGLTAAQTVFAAIK